MKKAIFEILEEASKKKSVDERAQYLRANDSQTLQYVLEGIYNPRIKWQLPEGTPPFKKNDLVGSETMLYNYARKMYLFFEGGHPNLEQVKREFLFIEMLESIHPKDAEVVLSMKDKKMPYKGITKNVIKKAFPNINMGD